MSTRIGPEYYGAERAESEAAKAERIVAEELQRGQWTAAKLSARPKGDPGKVALATRLRAETTKTVAWIAGRLGMGTRGHLNHHLCRRWQFRPECIIKNPFH